jgi:hypothetical protein
MSEMKNQLKEQWTYDIEKNKDKSMYEWWNNFKHILTTLIINKRQHPTENNIKSMEHLMNK